jgi:hypothetical protein
VAARADVADVPEEVGAALGESVAHRAEALLALDRVLRRGCRLSRRRRLRHTVRVDDPAEVVSGLASRPGFRRKVGGTRQFANRVFTAEPVSLI